MRTTQKVLMGPRRVPVWTTCGSLFPQTSRLSVTLIRSFPAVQNTEKSVAGD
jgi:hypothetical protein